MLHVVLVRFCCCYCPLLGVLLYILVCASGISYAGILELVLLGEHAGDSAALVTAAICLTLYVEWFANFSACISLFRRMHAANVLLPGAAARTTMQAWQADVESDTELPPMVRSWTVVPGW